uniref:Uncharacterized protein n=1 Tax=Plectus sambesii TaxID=2011161 RepID=A0A914W447_9BILA
MELGTTTTGSKRPPAGGPLDDNKRRLVRWRRSTCFAQTELLKTSGGCMLGGRRPTRVRRAATGEEEEEPKNRYPALVRFQAPIRASFIARWHLSSSRTAGQAYLWSSD